MPVGLAPQDSGLPPKTRRSPLIEALAHGTPHVPSIALELTWEGSLDPWQRESAANPQSRWEPGPRSGAPIGSTSRRRVCGDELFWRREEMRIRWVRGDRSIRYASQFVGLRAPRRGEQSLDALSGKPRQEPRSRGSKLGPRGHGAAPCALALLTRVPAEPSGSRRPGTLAVSGHPLTLGPGGLAADPADARSSACGSCRRATRRGPSGPRSRAWPGLPSSAGTGCGTPVP